MSERVSIEIKDGIADVRLNRPEKMNAIDAAMFNGLVAAGRKLAEDASVRVVVLSGEGRAFCAGLDFSSFQAMEGSERDENVESAFGRDGESPANAGQRAAFIWQELPMPVIAAVRGPAFGGGLQIALGADIRYVRPDAQLSVMEIKWGLVPDHERHADTPAPHLARRGEGAGLHGQGHQRHRGRAAWPRDASRRKPTGGGHGDGA